MAHSEHCHTVTLRHRKSEEPAPRGRAGSPQQKAHTARSPSTVRRETRMQIEWDYFPPQSRPARTLVLTFMMSSSVLVIALQMTIGSLVGRLPPPPQSRPARTFVLTFMFSSSCESILDNDRVLSRQAAAATAITTCANFRLDLHVQLLL